MSETVLKFIYNHGDFAAQFGDQVILHKDLNDTIYKPQHKIFLQELLDASFIHSRDLDILADTAVTREYKRNINDFILDLRALLIKLNQQKTEPDTDHSMHVNETKYEAGVSVTSGGGKQTELMVRFDLVPQDALAQIANVLYTGAKKYGVDNWKNIATNDHVNHALYHLNQFLITKDYKHLINASCRCMFGLQLEAEKTNV